MRYPRISIPVWHTLPLALLLLLIAACSRHEERLRQLEQLEARNSADSMMTDDALAEALASYFDNGGTPNERMRAHYILARTYADLGETPAALQSFLDAADAADTTAADCDWAKLSRVHAQSARLYHQQIQLESQLEALRLAQYYAWKAHDTLIAIECFAQTAGVYSLRNQPDYVLKIRESAIEQYKAINQYARAAMQCSGAMSAAIDLKDIVKAKMYANEYEKHSNLFNEDGTIKHGREIYYYNKGRLFLAENKLDSAEHSFRLLLHKGLTLNDQIAANKGLQELFKQRDIVDSVAKYADIGYALNDSAYLLSEMENIQRVKAMYNYNRNKLLAEENASKAARTKFMLLLLTTIMCVILFVAVCFFVIYRNRKQLRLLQYKHDLEMLERAQSELMELYEDENLRHSSIVKRKDEQIKELQQRIESNSKDEKKKEALMKESTVVNLLDKKANSNPPEQATIDEMKQLRLLINTLIPSFYGTLNGPNYIMSPIEYNVCLLIRVHFTPSKISRLLGISESHLWNIRKKLLQKVFITDGAASDFDSRILSIG